MRINDPNNLEKVLPAPVVETTTQPAVQTARTPSTTGNTSSDRADLSSVAGKLTEMLQPDTTRTERIRQLREAVAGDTYQPDSSAISRAIVDEALSAKPSARQE